MGKYGIYTIGDGLTQSQLNTVADVANGCRFRFKWSQIETAADVFNFTSIKASMDVAYNNGKYIWLQLIVSPCQDPTLSNYNCPPYLFNAPYSVPKVYTSTSGANLFYPHYTNANFVTRQKNFLNKVFEWLATLPLAYRQKIILFISSEGKTGDSGPYSGTPTNPTYNITNAAWNTHKYDLWDYQKSRIAFFGLTYLGFMLNPSNDGENVQKGLNDYDGINFKCGDNSHNTDYNGSKNLSSVYTTFRDPATGGDFENIVGGEFEQTDTQAYYTINPRGYLLPFVCFNLAAGSSIINIAPQKMIGDRFAYNLFNEFADLRNATDTDRGLIMFRDRPDFNDTVRFPENSTYFTVIDPARLSGANGYTQKYNNIINGSLPDLQKTDRITTLRIQYINPARISAIVSAVNTANYVGITTNRDYDTHNEDFGFDVLKGNFERYMHMYDQFGTSKGAWRYRYNGSHGRYVLLLTDDKPKWYFYNDFTSGGDYQVSIKIIYCNHGTGSFEVYYYNGSAKVSAGIVTCTNTDEYIEKIYTVTHFVGGRKLAIPAVTDKCDFTIEKVGTGDEIAFSMMRFIRVAENTTPPSNIPPVVNAGSDASYDAPIASFTLNGSASDPDGDSLFFNWIKTSGPACSISNFTTQSTAVTGPDGGNVLPGTYIFSFKVLDSRGAMVIDQVTIIVNPEEVEDLQPPIAIITEPPVVYVNEIATFSAASSYDTDGGIAARLWTLTGPAGFSIDSTTAIAVNINVTIPGIYQLTLLVTDNDDLTDEQTISFEAIAMPVEESPLLALPKLEWLHFIADKDYRTASLNNGAVIFNIDPTPFKQHPEGWKEIQVAFGTNEKYFSLNRSFSLPLRYVGDAAAVLRNRAYKYKGYEEELYAMIFRWNRDNGKHELEYRGRIDMSKISDRPLEGVNVNTIEGGVLSYLNANDSKTYEIAGDETNPAIIKVKFDGINLTDKHIWSTYEYEFNSEFSFIPLTYLKNEGDSVGVITGGQLPEEIDINNFTDFLQESTNYPFNSINAINAGRLYGRLRFESLENDGIPAPGATRTIFWLLRSNNAFNSAQWVELYRVVDQPGNIYAFDFDVTFNLAANEKMFIAVDCVSLSSGDHRIKILNALDTDGINFEIITRNTESKVYAIRPLDLLKQLVAAFSDNRFTADSLFFAANNNIVAFCGDALRNTKRDVVPLYKLATTFSDFFKAYNSFYNLAMKVVDNVLYVERKSDIYNNPDNIIFDLGEVTELEIKYTEERIVNSVKCGYADEDYSQRNGKYEFNSSREFGLPVVAVQRVYDITCPYRGDAFGQEFIRDVLENKDTTDNTGDKSVLVAVIDEASASNEEYQANLNDPQVYASGDLIAFETLVGNYFTPNDELDEFTYTGIAQTVKANVFFNIDNDGAPVSVALLKNGISIQSLFITAANGNDIDFDVENIPLAPADILSVSVINPGSTLTSTIVMAQLEIKFTTVLYELSRPAYDILTGVLDNSVYNTEISPARQLRAHGSYLKGLLYQLQDKEITFQTGQKNINLSTTKDGVTITENANVPVSELDENFFIPYEAEFKAKPPYTFAETLAKMSAGLIKFSFNGYDIVGLPIGEMSCKPATNDPQTWKLLLHKSTSLTTLLMLGSSGNFININSGKMLFLTDLNPVHFVKYNYEPNAKYHHKEMHDDWTHNRHERFAAQPAYLQKFQNNDTINLQIITSYLGQIEVYVYDRNANFVQSYPFVYAADAAVLFPATKQLLSIDLQDYNEGEYLLVIRSATTNLLISEWISIKEDWPQTYLYEYYHTTNKLEAYFTDWRPSIRCEGFMHVPQPDSAFVTYEDEPGDLEMLRGRPSMKRILTIGNGDGIPEWMANKINNVLLLNRLSIDGTRFTRNADSKMEVEEREGYPLNIYRTEIRNALNEAGITVNDEGAEVINGITAYTLDAKAFGRNDDVITITTTNE